MPGPSSWKGDKRRAKRPQTAEAKRSQEQQVGRLARQVVSRPEPQEVKPTIKKQANQRPLQTNEKRLRALNKLLRQIEDLQQREADGIELDEQQSQKVARLDDVLEEMEGLLAGDVH